MQSRKEAGLCPTPDSGDSRAARCRQESIQEAWAANRETKNTSPQPPHSQDRADPVSGHDRSQIVM